MIATPKTVTLVPAPAQAGERGHHDHRHHDHADHAHDHDHGDPDHAHHSHDVAGKNRRSRTIPSLSLIGLSAFQRLVLALPAIGLLWLLTLWAVSNG